ncbi:MAG: ATP-binding protein [Chrysiogenia bacterium]
MEKMVFNKENHTYSMKSYFEDKKEIEYIDDLLEKVIPLFNICYLPRKREWPYQLNNNDFIKASPNYSFSTNANIIHSIFALHISDFKSIFTIDKRKDEIIAIIKKSFDQAGIQDNTTQIIDDALKRFITKSTRLSNNLISTSNSFGQNDPLTLSWIIELLKYDMEQASNVFSTPYKNKFIRISLSRLKETFYNYRDGCLVLDLKIPNAFTFLKFIHLFTVFNKIESHLNTSQQTIFNDIKNKVGEVGIYCLEQLNQHLAYYNIKDSSFDAAELVFFLESILQLNIDKPTLDRNLINRVFEVIEGSQKNSPYWRPLKPFVYNSMGFELLPLSIEIANSLIRICLLLKDQLKDNSFFSQEILVFKRYFAWLGSRVVDLEIQNSDKSFYGWPSEHIQVSSNPHKIHPWQVAQVMFFLQNYRILLQKHISDSLLNNMNFTMKFPKREGDFLMLTSTYWENYWQIKEPLIDFTNTQYKVLEQIKRNFLETRNSIYSKNDNFSMILFGPPGTGKTSIANEIAKALKWGLITITPSDFIAEGESGVEAQAKEIFMVLEEQEDVVVLFDEIDRLILDRDSDKYKDQSDIFQFMTPSMLVKLQNLREKKKLIFIISSNYEDDIDSAAKRKGRIDAKYLIMPPGRDQRFRIIKYIIEENCNTTFFNTINLMPITDFDRALKRTALSSYGDIKKYVLNALKISPHIRSFMANFNSERVVIEAPEIKLTKYENRLFRGSPAVFQSANKWLIREFFLLLYIKLEVSNYASLTEGEESIVGRVLDAFFSGQIRDIRRLRFRSAITKFRGLISENQVENRIINADMIQWLRTP